MRSRLSRHCSIYIYIYIHIHIYTHTPTYVQPADGYKKPKHVAKTVYEILTNKVVLTVLSVLYWVVQKHTTATPCLQEVTVRVCLSVCLSTALNAASYTCTAQLTALITLLSQHSGPDFRKIKQVRLASLLLSSQ
jgi:hypothetical protein